MRPLTWRSRERRSCSAPVSLDSQADATYVVALEQLKQTEDVISQATDLASAAVAAHDAKSNDQIAALKTKSKNLYLRIQCERTQHFYRRFLRDHTLLCPHIIDEEATRGAC